MMSVGLVAREEDAVCAARTHNADTRGNIIFGQMHAMNRTDALHTRLTAWAASLAAGLGFIGIMSLLLTDGRVAVFLLDRNSTVFAYPLDPSSYCPRTYEECSNSVA